MEAHYSLRKLLATMLGIVVSVVLLMAPAAYLVF
jgi:hypothetical protein